MRRVAVRAVLRDELHPPAAEGLVEMFSEASEISAERFDRRIAEETSKLRLDFAEMKSDVLKWSFLFWLGQVAAVASLLGLLLKGR